MTDPFTGDIAPESQQVEPDGIDAGQTAAGADEQTAPDVHAADVSPDDEPQGDDDVDSSGDNPDAPNDETVGGREARYRREAREAQAKLAEMTAVVDGMRWEQIKQIALNPGPAPEGSREVRPAFTAAALEAANIDIAAAINESGAIDAGLLEAQLGPKAKAFGLRPAPTGFTPDRGQGMATEPAKPKPTIADQFRR